MVDSPLLAMSSSITIKLSRRATEQEKRDLAEYEVPLNGRLLSSFVVGAIIARVTR
jgi:hypothetical protein